jgi:RNA polymerase sigma factor (sigma-70 family)
MMSEHETILLRQFAKTGDAEAFSEITRHYAGMVYGTCLRVTGDAERARDATQDTFFQLLKQAGKVTGSLGGWLHQVATRRAVDLVRRDSARRQRERAFAADAVQETDAWAEVSPLVDEAMSEIEADQRELLLRHFLQGESTVQMAAAEGVSQPTMSRRVEAALEQLRGRLRMKGVGVAASVLGAIMAGTSQGAPAMVLAELGKMALATSGTAAASTATATVLGLNAKLAVAAAIAVVAAGGYVAYKSTRPAEAAPPVVAATQPAAAPTVPAEPAGTQAGVQEIPAATPAAGAPIAGTPTRIGAARVGGVGQTQGFGGGAMQGGGGAFGGAVAVVAGQGMGGMMAMGAPTTTRATPEGAVKIFVAALVRGDPARLSECFEGTIETNTLRRVIENPASDEERALQQAFTSLGSPVEVLGATALEDSVRLKCRATVRKPFTLVKDGTTKTWQSRDWFELEVRLKQVGTEWKLVGL